MSVEQLIGTIVYHRKIGTRGKIKSYSGANLIVKWDTGYTEALHFSELMSEKLWMEQSPPDKVNKTPSKSFQGKPNMVVYRVGTSLPLAKGTLLNRVVSNDDDKYPMAVVEWDSTYISKEYLENLLSEEDGLAEIQRLTEEKKDFEKKFQEVQSQCEEKLDQAAALIREANEMASSINERLPNVCDFYDLKDSLNEAGWRGSSLSC